MFVAPAAAQNSIGVRIRNASSDRIYVTVYDSVCRRVVFDGFLARRASTTVSVCSGRNRRGSIVVTDSRGLRRRFRNLIHPETVDLQFGLRRFEGR